MRLTWEESPGVENWMAPPGTEELAAVPSFPRASSSLIAWLLEEEGSAAEPFLPRLELAVVETFHTSLTFHKAKRYQEN